MRERYLELYFYRQRLTKKNKKRKRETELYKETQRPRYTKRHRGRNIQRDRNREAEIYKETETGIEKKRAKENAYFILSLSLSLFLPY